jgi:hypothetical protein
MIPSSVGFDHKEESDALLGSFYQLERSLQQEIQIELIGKYIEMNPKKVG